MSEEVWSGSEDVWGATDADNSDNPSIRVNGSDIYPEVGDSFKEAIKECSFDAGFGKFRVILNGEEIKPSEAPELIVAGMRIEVLPYDVPGVE